MNRNPLIPFLLIAIMGIGLVFILSIKGLYDAKEIAGEGNKTAQENKADASPEEIYKANCVTCHGENYEGVSGPKLKGVGDHLDKGQIKEKIEKGGNGMPAGLVPAEKLDDMAKWVSELK
ncbi:cytochrome c [Bacillus sonorensis]|uniref:Cytochrome c-550 n=2 Tax=Bacillus sonorensis TaxID=119858 RepID=M5P671_9BACI|nr:MULTISPECIES: cytochrome c [Bacillus]TWK76169.1 Cytochrome c-550 [Bacillus paralicheniformis]ASB88332.1 Cytochrome c-550 [Bacillus sonorensis]EME74904.1 cytochrome c-550 [Bacillus sonorensis L12]MBG9916181.1 cytochrome C' [Bacillus sonorensis]MCF7617768.1 cytochrome c [Bacillus sonorensis]